MKIRFHCVNKLSDRHDKDIDLTDLIMWPWPTCCGTEMRPVDEAEWRRISKSLGRVQVELQQAGLPSLAGMLCHTEGRLPNTAFPPDSPELAAAQVGLITRRAGETWPLGRNGGTMKASFKCGVCGEKLTLTGTPDGIERARVMWLKGHEHPVAILTTA